VIESGDAARGFELPDDDGRAVKLSDYRRTPFVVYFYAKANASGCFFSTAR
jgi:peroxiredoxin Q/BCP